jgi:hypothetical protein
MVPFKPDDYRTYSNLVINKPKIEIGPTNIPSVSNVNDGATKSISEKLLSTQKAVTTKVASTFM